MVGPGLPAFLRNRYPRAKKKTELSRNHDARAKQEAGPGRADRLGSAADAKDSVIGIRLTRGTSFFAGSLDQEQVTGRVVAGMVAGAGVGDRRGSPTGRCLAIP